MLSTEDNIQIQKSKLLYWLDFNRKAAFQGLKMEKNYAKPSVKTSKNVR